LARLSAIFGAYLLLSALVTWPLVRDMRTLIAGGTTDPVLNAAVLQWNATTPPFSREWWNPPHYYPATGVAAFTESLVGVSPIASPVYWLTRNPILAYNLSVFLTWPLSAFAAYLLVRFLTRREDAALLSGLSFGFSPYRVAGFPHIQTLATFGIALCLLGMHGYLERRRWPWLALFGLGWLQQSFANGYYTLYGALIVAMWLLYFCARRGAWRAGLTLFGTAIIFSLPLLPMLIGFRTVHDQYGLHRTYSEILYFSALTHSWFETHAAVWLWHRVFLPGKDNMFPGITAVVLLVGGVLWLLSRRSGADPTSSTHDHWRLRAALAAGTAISAVAIAINLLFGRIDTSVLGIPLKMTDVSRALIVMLACGIPLAYLTPRIRTAVAARSPLLFYAAATVIVALLSFGPELRAGDDVIWKPAPYGWLMALPGFNEARVPTQIKMIDILCLAVAAGLAFCAIRPRRPRLAMAVWALAATGFVLDGWMARAEMMSPPALWPAVEPSDRPEPILELPLGPGDYGATLRAASHRRRVFNGVSGYDPPHYFALKEGVAAHDPAVLRAIASLTSFDIVVDGDEDPGGIEAQYAAGAPGAIQAASDGRRTLFRVPKAAEDSRLGDHWPIAGVRVAHHEEWKSLMLDGNPETGWADLPADPDAWVIADLGQIREVAAVTESIGGYSQDFPRYLIIEGSRDGDSWNRLWEGPTYANAVLGFIRAPRSASLNLPFAARSVRYVRLRETARPTNWRIQELRIYGPSR
jgi:F5/8 type C domain-containing protein